MAVPRTVLIIDDEESICLAFRRFFERRGWGVRFTSTGARGLALYRESRPDVVFLDVRLPDTNGLDVLDTLRKEDPDARVIIITAFGSLEIVMRAVHNKAFDYLVKPLDLDKAFELAGRAAETGAPITVRLAAEVASETAIIGSSPVIQQVYKQVALTAQSDAGVLIVGQTGTGKELIARAIHKYSARRGKPFVAVNCGALPYHLIESELFGCVRGAFTGADADRAGRFESADTGTLFLDEVAELPVSAQVKLLRFLDSQLVERLGSTKPIQVDVRIIAATNRDLDAAVKAGKFRADLFYRLAVMRIELPPLAQRAEDILPLARHFLAMSAVPGQPVRQLSPEAVLALQRYSWPGNVRELKNAVEHAAVIAAGGFILPEHLPLPVRMSAGESGGRFEQLVREHLATLPADAGNLYHSVLESAEREVIRHALQRCHGNQSEAAELLGVHRNTLRHRLRDLGIDPEA